MLQKYFRGAIILRGMSEGNEAIFSKWVKYAGSVDLLRSYTREGGGGGVRKIKRLLSVLNKGTTKKFCIHGEKGSRLWGGGGGGV